jgi:hypothetical protein
MNTNGHPAVRAPIMAMMEPEVRLASIPTKSPDLIEV